MMYGVDTLIDMLANPIGIVTIVFVIVFLYLNVKGFVLDDLTDLERRIYNAILESQFSDKTYWNGRIRGRSLVLLPIPRPHAEDNATFPSVTGLSEEDIGWCRNKVNTHYEIEEVSILFSKDPDPRSPAERVFLG